MAPEMSWKLTSNATYPWLFWFTSLFVKFPDQSSAQGLGDKVREELHPASLSRFGPIERQVSQPGSDQISPDFKKS